MGVKKEIINTGIKNTILLLCDDIERKLIKTASLTALTDMMSDVVVNRRWQDVNAVKLCFVNCTNFKLTR